MSVNIKLLFLYTLWMKNKKNIGGWQKEKKKCKNVDSYKITALILTK